MTQVDDATTDSPVPDTLVPDTIVQVTDPAREKVLEVRASEPDAERLALWIEVSGQQAGAYTYLMEFRPTDTLPDGVELRTLDDLTIAVPGDSVERLTGATLDLGAGGMVMQNPNQPAPPPRKQGDLSGELAQRVLEVLEEQVNPQVASHGGSAELVAVEGSTAYVRMAGGCQGCGMAAATLKDGIEVMILDIVPEITEVVDVTDHAAGSNPYYEPSH